MVSGRRMVAINRRRRQVQLETKGEPQQCKATNKMASIELFKRRRESGPH